MKISFPVLSGLFSVKEDSKIFLLLLLLCFVFWNIPNPFFLADSWLFLYRVQEFSLTNLLMLEGEGHFEPLNKLLLFVIANLFGENAYFYFVTMLVLWSYICYQFYKILCILNISPEASLLFSVFLLIHPVCWWHLLYIFNVSQIIPYALLSVLFIKHLLMYILDSSKTGYLFSAFLFLILSNYFASYSIFLPLLPVLFFVFFSAEKSRTEIYKIALISVLAFAFLVFVQYWFSNSEKYYPYGKQSGLGYYAEFIFSNPSEFLGFVFYYTGLQNSKLIFLNSGRPATMWISSVFILFLFVNHVLHNRRDKLIWFLFFWYSLASLVLIISRSNRGTLWDAHNFSNLIPLSALVFYLMYSNYEILRSKSGMVMSEPVKRKFRVFATLFTGFLFLIIYYKNFLSKNQFDTLGYFNKNAIENAIANNIKNPELISPFWEKDDFKNTLNIKDENISDSDLVISIYSFWKEKKILNIPMKSSTDWFGQYDRSSDK